MHVQELLTTLHQRGIILTPLPGNKLAIRPASKLTPELRAELKQRKSEVLALLHPHPDHRAVYHEAAIVLADDCYAIDPCWLIERYPELWARMRALDAVLNEMEQQGVSEVAYSARLAELTEAVREARTRYEQEGRPETVQ